MITKTKRIIPKYYRDSKVSKLVEFGEKLFLTCLTDFNIFVDYEKLVYQLFPSELFKEYLEIMYNKLEKYTSKYEDYSAFIVENTENDYIDNET